MFRVTYLNFFIVRMLGEIKKERKMERERGEEREFV